MQYILSEKEYKELQEQANKSKTAADKWNQNLCTKIADTMPVKWGWGGPDPKPWGCIITAEKEGEEWYCDSCPVKEVCPNNHKDWSK